ncbi:MAG: protein kinase [Myxococcota bacterium]|nr:protein kinase [Myxococcota bacterium]
MGRGGFPQDDDRPTVDLGPRAPTDQPGLHLQDESADDDGPGTDGTHSLVDAVGELETRTIQAPASVHALPTQQLPLRSKRPSGHSSSLTKLSGTSAASSPIDAMRHDEIERTRVFLKVAIVTAVGGVILAWLTSGDPLARWAVIIGSALVNVGAAWILVLTRDPARYTSRKIVPGVMLIAMGAMGGLYYWGAASPVAAMIVYGIYFFGLGSDARITTALYVTIAALHGGLATAIATGAITDRGIINMSGLAPADQVGVILVIEALYFIAFFTARVSQRVTLDAMSKLEVEVRNVAQRDALLAEARAELDRALKIGGPGRFTDQTVGSFRLGVLIGRGGMGEVYEAHHVTDNSEAAVKLLHPGTLADPTHVQRFLREAKTAASLDCPNVVRVLEVGTTAGEVPFLAMERLRGFDLAHQLRRQRKLQLLQAKVFAQQVAIGLEAARAAGIVHRDLKPHNVFFAEQQGERLWKVLDFGVSKVGGSGTLTKGHVVGTPAYMAPEQARGEDVDHRADVYSLAAILYRTVTGHPAFSGKDVPSTLYDVVYRVPTQPSILSSLTSDVDRVLAIGLAKRAKDRFETATELATWFATAIDGELGLEQRQRADEVISRYPWGTRPGFAELS